MAAVDTIFGMKQPKTWLLIFACFLYFALCWVAYTFLVAKTYGALDPPGIAADSADYFEVAARVADQGVALRGLVGVGGSPLGPMTVALLGGQSEFGVACVNCLLFLLTIWWAGFIPGVRRELFVLLMALNLQTLPSLMTLNKEILAIAGLVAFAAYLYPRDSFHKRGSIFLLAAAIVLSILARWEQVFILFWYLIAEANFSPVRGKPRRAVVALLLLASAAYAAAVHVVHADLGGFISQIEGGGTIVRLYSIQEKGGYFLVAFPKILMNLAGRFVTPAYFLNEYWVSLPEAKDWQNAYVGIFASLAMLSIIGVAFLMNRFRLSRPLIHLTVIYFICTAINPFIQPRYMYPGYALLALELSRRRRSLEPAPDLPLPPALPRSYLEMSAR